MAGTQSWLPKLGLDLRGGTTITLTAKNVDPATGNAVDQNSLEQARLVIQNRVDSLGVGESEVTVSGDNQIVVSVPNMQEQELIDLVGQTAILNFRLVYLAQPVAPMIPSPSGSPSGTPSGEGSAQPSGEPTGSAVPSGEPSGSATTEGNGRPAPNLPTVPPPSPGSEGADIPEAESMGWQPTEAEYQQFMAYTCDQPPVDNPRQPLITCSEDGTEKLLLGPSIIEGQDLTDANAGIPQGELQWVVNLSFNNEAAQTFAEATTMLSQKQEPQNRFAIVLDGTSISAPTVDKPIPGGQAMIQGNFNQQSAQQLANVLKYGALPLAFDISSVDTVSATLGGEQLEAGMIAGAIGLALVLLYAIAYYRGLFVVIISSLAIAAAMTYACMVLLGESMGFALNLPGIAGAIVAIGVTADSFIIYFERIRDEVREGRTLRTAVETGWQRARSTIIISDAVSMLSAIILFILAIGSVKGFAFTLGLTTIIDLAVVLFFTKPLVVLLARTKFFGGGHKLSGLDARHLGVKSLPGRRRAVAGGRA
ncbi:protein translocase subunit SecD [Propionibacteriaceae bacterium Y2011]